ncbi:xanthine dehydrogenase family protein molybdopterin-binding subunit [Hartmannibacter diazotrophicus]|nr:xanthine dehydrogenase family protein molybdopterin-binding subunit [Hartmannibacter diazotrophicus]
MLSSPPPKFGIGAPVRRREDPAFITGTGRYTDDIAPEGAFHAVVLRSQMAHAKFTIEGLDDARALPGVKLILTHADIAHLGGLPCHAAMKQSDGTRIKVPPHPVLADGVVRHVGDPIAFVVADTAIAARDAAEAIMVDYEGLDVVVDTAAALSPDAPLVWPDKGTNLAFEYHGGDEADADRVFAKADRVVSISIINQRLVSNYMEPRSAIGQYDPETTRYTLTTGTQGGHEMRHVVAKDIMKIDEKRLRVVTPDVGGGFGTKNFCYSEYPLVLIAAEKLGAPVKWTGERFDHFVIDSHGRDNVTTAEAAIDANGKILALKVDLVAAMGAYLHQFGPYIPQGGILMATGLYDIPSFFVRVRGVYTNTTATDAYRGAGRPEAAYLIERLIDKIGRETGLGQVEVRRRNFIPQEKMPYTTVSGQFYDSGEFEGHLAEALKQSDFEGFAARREAAKAKGLLRGIGLSTYVEICAFPGSEEANITVNDDGSATLFIGTQSNGQGHATAYGQVIAEYLGLDLEKVETVQGDTDRVRTGGGTGGSRSIPLGLASVDIASKVLVKQLKELAADKLESAVEDLELAEGQVRVVGTDRAVSLSELASGTADKDKLKASGKFQQDGATYPNGTHVCEIEIDPDTGVTKIVNYTIVDDFGVTVNPMLLEGQVHGGVAQSIGQALLEGTAYDESGQLLTASFLDYTMPRADDLPSFHFATRNVPSTTNMLGIKGAGEAGTIGATPAVMNAVVDALDAVRGIRHFDMPATPARLWHALNEA